MRKDWKETTLGEVVTVKSGFAFKSKDFVSGGVPVVKIANVKNGKINLEGCSFVSEAVAEMAAGYELTGGDLVITMTGDVGAVGRVSQSQSMLVNQRVGKVQSISPYSSLDFIELVLRWDLTRTKFEGLAAGLAQPNISPRQIESVTLSLPPLAEQRRIVDVIASVDTYIDALQKRADTARNARSALLHELLTAGGEDWKETTLGEIGSEGMFADGDWVESKDQDPNGEYRLLQLADIGDCRFLNKSNRWLNFEQFQRLGCTELKPEDILIARMPDPIARACLLPADLPTCATVVDVAILRCGPKFNPRFLVLLINDSKFRSAAAALLTGTTRQRISRSNLSAIGLTLPSATEQRRIVDVIESVDSTVTTAEDSVANARSLRSALLSDLLSGDHEIPKSYDKFLGAA